MAPVPRSALPSGGSIILLNGASSSGKTSLAKALRSALPQQHYLHVQLDTFREMEPVGYFGREQAAAWSLRVAALCRAMHATVAEYAAHGQNVIWDHVLSDDDAWHYLLENLHGQRLYLIGIRCAVDELVRRELARGNRPHGLAQSQVASVHEGREYDLSVDTTRSNPAECAEAIVQWLQCGPEPSAFARMRARQNAA